MYSRRVQARAALVASILALVGCEPSGNVTVDWAFSTVAGAAEPCPAGVSTVLVEIRGRDAQTGFYDEHERDCAAGTSGPIWLSLGQYEATTSASSVDGFYDRTTQFALSNDDPAMPRTEAQLREEFVVDGGRVDVEVAFEGGFIPAPIGCQDAFPTIRVTWIRGTGLVERHDVPCAQHFTLRAQAGKYQADISLLDPDGNTIQTSPRTMFEMIAPDGDARIGYTFSGL